MIVKENPRSSNGSRGKRFSQGTDEPFRTSPVFLLCCEKKKLVNGPQQSRVARPMAGTRKRAMSVRGLRPRSSGAWASD